MGADCPLLPGKDGDPECSGENNQLFSKAVFWPVRADAPRRDLPERFGEWGGVEALGLVSFRAMPEENAEKTEEPKLEIPILY